MNLILWRHAEAEPGADDMARALTHKGQRQADAMGQWLRQHLPEGTRILCSPAVRAVQTVQALGRPYELCPAIAPEQGEYALLSASGWPESGDVLLVGHQPALGRLAALLLSGTESDWSVKKGAIWWFAHRVREGREQVVLHTVLGPGIAGSD